MKEFKSRVAVVTGGASGIGRAVAERLGQEGMKLVLADIEEGALAKAEGELKNTGLEVLSVVTDVSKPGQVEALARRALERYGAVHVLFNNAGVATTGATWENSLADWEWVLGVNLWGVIHGIRTFVPILLEQGTEGHVVNTASVAGLTSNPFMGMYNVSKHAVVTLSETLHKELLLSISPVKVSVLCPGFVVTRIMDAARNRPTDPHQDPPKPEASLGAIGAEQALRAGVDAGFTPDEVAQQVFEGIRDERFYIVPAQPEIEEAIRQRLQDVGDRRNPAPAGLPAPDA
jgi:NAD(P)-dependent dehydrogenase (short-subunit alcohol dehydrogenase family)